MKKLLILLLISPLLGNATNYYFSQAGSDGNNGTSTLTPKKTAAAFNAMSFSADDTIFWRRGDTIRDAILTIPSSGTSGHPVVISSYGTGVYPVFAGSDLKTSGWTAFSSNVWQVAATTSVNVAYFNGVLGVKMTSAGAIVAPGQWFWASNVFYCFAPSGVNPTTTYTTPGIEIGIRNNAITTNNKTDVEFWYIQAMDGNAAGFAGTVKVGSTTANRIKFHYCTVRRGRACGFDLNGSTTFDNVTIDHCDVIDNGQIGILYEKNSATFSEINNCNALRNGWATNIDGAQFSNVQGDLSNVFLHDCLVEDAAPVTSSQNTTSHGIYYSTASTAYFYCYNNVIRNNRNGNGVKSRYNIWLYNNVISGNRVCGFEMGQNGSTDQVAYVIKNKFYGGNWNGGFNAILENTKGAGKVSLNCFGNGSYKHGGISSEMNITDDMDTIRVENNIWWAATGRSQIQVPAQTHTNVIDYNDYWRDDGTCDNIYSGTHRTLAAGIANTSFDDHSLNVLPQLTSLPTDWTPVPTSPVIGVGVSGLAYLTCIGGACEIGPVELGAVAPTPIQPVAATNGGNRTRVPFVTGTLDGSGSYDSDGTISTYAWTFVSGPNTPTITSASSVTTTITGLIYGTYVFQLTVTDNDGLTGSIYVTYYVTGGAGMRN